MFFKFIVQRSKKGTQAFSVHSPTHRNFRNFTLKKSALTQFHLIFYDKIDLKQEKFCHEKIAGNHRKNSFYKRTAAGNRHSDNRRHFSAVCTLRKASFRQDIIPPVWWNKLQQTSTRARKNTRTAFSPWCRTGACSRIISTIPTVFPITTGAIWPLLSTPETPRNRQSKKFTSWTVTGRSQNSVIPPNVLKEKARWWGKAARNWR